MSGTVPHVLAKTSAREKWRYQYWRLKDIRNAAASCTTTHYTQGIVNICDTVIKRAANLANVAKVRKYVKTQRSRNVPFSLDDAAFESMSEMIAAWGDGSDESKQEFAKGVKVQLQLRADTTVTPTEGSNNGHEEAEHGQALESAGSTCVRHWINSLNSILKHKDSIRANKRKNAFRKFTSIFNSSSYEALKDLLSFLEGVEKHLVKSNDPCLQYFEMRAKLQLVSNNLKNLPGIPRDGDFAHALHELTIEFALAAATQARPTVE